MNAIIAIETSTEQGSVALAVDNVLMGEIIIGENKQQNQALLPAIDQLLRAAGCGRADLGAVVIGGGPGSFTGLRVAAATAKGFVHALGIPLYAYSGLLATALTAEEAGAQRVCALFDARREEVYSATYQLDGDLSALRGPTVENIGHCLSEQDPSGVTFVGGGALKHRARIEQGGGRVYEPALPGPRASALIRLQARAPALGAVTQPRSWEPDYLRASGAERGLNL